MFQCSDLLRFTFELCSCVCESDKTCAAYPTGAGEPHMYNTCFTDEIRPGLSDSSETEKLFARIVRRL